jgi:hypothetical protein
MGKRWLQWHLFSGQKCQNNPPSPLILELCLIWRKHRLVLCATLHFFHVSASSDWHFLKTWHFFPFELNMKTKKKYGCQQVSKEWL